MLWAQLGPLGSLVDLPDVLPVQITAERGSSELTTIGGRRHVQRGVRAPRAWAVSSTWLQPQAAAFLEACAQDAVPGPLYLLTSDAAVANLLPPHLAAPGAGGDRSLGALGTNPSTVTVPGIGPMRGVAFPTSPGPWSETVPVRPSVALTLSCWAASPSTIGSGAGLLSWRTVNAAGAQVASGIVTAPGGTTTLRATTSFTPAASAVGVQLRPQTVVAGTLTAIRLTEGPPATTDWVAGRGGARVVVEDPAQTLNLVRGSTSFADYSWVLKEVG
ncbi:hypothetical protein [Cellulomonas uda]|uniref:Uncharacterized protein n=1 Tax=Cellulomonas uda TaxID=1714 RepID=A0A4Y3K5Y6_CELUD|nr:hypothetical protein [Cellulomonas uda]NII67822.1 hypothetical protein [Cellulomonas uda]GEA79931.1 hypothetical protein CUD01_03750 [Cellulomonas uda]